MTLAMTRPTKHPKTGIYQFRRVIPDDLQALIGKREEKRSLGTKDPDEAKRRFATVLAEVESRWANLRAGPRSLSEREAHELAVPIYQNWLKLHRENPSEQYFWHTDLYGGLWTSGTSLERDNSKPLTSRDLHDILIEAMRRFCFRQADHGLELYGFVVDAEGRGRLAKAIGAAFQRGSLILEQEEQGIFSDSVKQEKHSHDEPVNLYPARPTAVSSTTITQLLQGWWVEAKATGRKPSTYTNYKNSIANFVKYLKHDRADRVTVDDVIKFKDYRLTTPSDRTGRVPSARTVKGTDLSALKAIFNWAVVNRKLTENPAANVNIKASKPQKLRSKGFSDSEAHDILLACLQYSATANRSLSDVAKRWVPWLCAYTGARVGEIAQLRKQDVIFQDGYHVIRITPEAGTVKTNEARLIVLHSCLVDQGFIEFVERSQTGHLFVRPAKNGNVLGPLQGLKNRLAEFARTIVSDPNVAPNHGWRHRFKTVGMESGIAPRILDAIQGQAARSVADTYGDVNLKTIADAIQRLPVIVIDITDGD